MSPLFRRRSAANTPSSASSADGVVPTPGNGTPGGGRVNVAEHNSGIQSSGPNATITQIKEFHERSLAVLPRAVEVPVPRVLSNLPVHGVFVGRAGELEHLATVMGAQARVVTQVLAGLGGIGKSTLAAEYARQHAARYTGVWWLNADSRANAEAGLADLARALLPGVADGHDAAVLAQWALSWIQHARGMLLVWDNVDDVHEVKPLLDVLAGDVHHLITSRRSGGWHVVRAQEPLRLGTLRSDDAVALLTMLAGPSLDPGIAADLCAELGDLPLAVEQVGAYLAESGTDAESYLADWRGGQGAVVDLAAEGQPGDRVIARVWRITLDRLADTPAAGNVLRIISWLAPDAIARTLLVPAVATPGELAEALRRLNAYSMITMRTGGGEVGVHRVVQAVARTPDPTDPHRTPEAVTAAQHAAIGLLATQLPDPDQPADDEAAWQILLPHVDAFAGHTAGRGVSTATAATAITVMNRAFKHLRTRRNLAAGVRITACLVASAVQHGGPDHPDTLAARNILASAYESAGDLGKAIPLYQATLTDSQRVLGPDDPDSLACQQNLANAYQSAGHLGKAIPLLQATLISWERVMGPDHPNTLISRNNLASAYQSAGHLAKAIPLLQTTLTDRTRVLGPDHPDTLSSRNNLAGAYESAGDLERAIPLLQTTLTDRTRVLGPDHPSTLISRHNLASAYQSAGDLEKAIPMHQATLISCERVLGPDHPNTLNSRNNLANAYQSAGDLEKAIPLHQATLTDRTRVLGPDHPDSLISRNNLASAYQSAGDLERAIPLHQATLTDRTRVLGPDHPDTLASRNNLASAHLSAGDLEKAIPLLQTTLADSERILGPDHPNTLALRDNLTYGHLSAGDLEKAIPLLQATVADSERILGPDHPKTVTVRKYLAAAYEARNGSQDSDVPIA